jgi:hypothetical protein
MAITRSRGTGREQNPAYGLLRPIYFQRYMTDQQKWNMAVATVSAEFGALPATARDRLFTLLQDVRQLKRQIHRYADVSDGSAICADCGGQCCATGKHHFTVIDLLVYLAEGKSPFVPRFSSGWCPYLGDDGCLMEADYRPYNCVTFNCDRIDSMLKPDEREDLMGAERNLRVLYRSIEQFLGNTFMQGLIITCERDLLRDRTSVLRLSESGSEHISRET